MNEEAILSELKRLGIEPYDGLMYSPSYPVSATLADGTFLPCVLIESSEKIVAQAKRRIEETSSHTKNYESYVRTMTCSFNRVSHHDIASISRSRFSIPASLHREVALAGETRMSYICFAGKFENGTNATFESSYCLEFFQMPEGLSGFEIVSVKPHQDGRGVKLHTIPYFSCFVSYGT